MSCWIKALAYKHHKIIVNNTRYSYIDYLFILQKNSVEKKKKVVVLKGIANSSKPDIANLKQHALTTSGFINSELRRKIWPLILGISLDTNPPSFGEYRILSLVDRLIKQIAFQN